MKNCVYSFLNKEKEIIYIGRAEDLEKRLSNHNHLPKECYKQLEYIEYIEFPTLEDSKIMERVLISKIKPKYNTEFKNNTVTLHIKELDNLKWQIYDPTLPKSNFPSIDRLVDGEYIIKVMNGKPIVTALISHEKTGSLDKFDTIDSSISDEPIEILEKAIKVIITKNQASASMLQRELKIGFIRAARLMDKLEELTIIGEYNATNNTRPIVINDIDVAISKLRKMPK